MGFLRELTDTELDAISGGAVSLFGGGSTGSNFAVGVSSGAAGTSAGSTGIPNTLFGAFVQFNGPGAGVGIT